MTAPPHNFTLCINELVASPSIDIDLLLHVARNLPRYLPLALSSPHRSQLLDVLEQTFPPLREPPTPEELQLYECIESLRVYRTRPDDEEPSYDDEPHYNDEPDYDEVPDYEPEDDEEAEEELGVFFEDTADSDTSIAYLLPIYEPPSRPTTSARSYEAPPQNRPNHSTHRLQPPPPPPHQDMPFGFGLILTSAGAHDLQFSVGNVVTGWMVGEGLSQRAGLRALLGEWKVMPMRSAAMGVEVLGTLGMAGAVEGAEREDSVATMVEVRREMRMRGKERWGDRWWDGKTQQHVVDRVLREVGGRTEREDWGVDRFLLGW